MSADQSYPGGFERIRRLGGGGMGEVWACRWHAWKDSLVAVKTIRPTLLADQGIRRRFSRECAILSRFSHERIARCYHADVDHDPPYLVLEHLEGPTLAERLDKDGSQDVVAIAAIGAHVAEALQYAHDHGVVHRDVKPSNVLLTARGAVLTDFGLAALYDCDERITGSGFIAGTLPYVAPEVLLGGPAASSADIYSLGTVLFECATGRLPFDGPTPVAQAVARLTSSPIRMRDLRSNVPEVLEDLLERCLARDAAERPSAADVENVLRCLATGGLDLALQSGPTAEPALCG